MESTRNSANPIGYTEQNYIRIVSEGSIEISRGKTIKMNYQDKGAEIGALVDRKNKPYGNSFTKSHTILKILYPQAIEPSQYGDMLAIIRIIDKMFRIATQKDAFGENPWQDIAGYAILKSVKEEEEK